MRSREMRDIGLTPVFRQNSRFTANSAVSTFSMLRIVEA